MASTRTRSRKHKRKRMRERRDLDARSRRDRDKDGTDLLGDIGKLGMRTVLAQATPSFARSDAQKRLLREAPGLRAALHNDLRRKNEDAGTESRREQEIRGQANEALAEMGKLELRLALAARTPARLRRPEQARLLASGPARMDSLRTTLRAIDHAHGDDGRQILARIGTLGLRLRLAKATPDALRSDEQRLLVDQGSEQLDALKAALRAVDSKRVPPGQDQLIIE